MDEADLTKKQREWLALSRKIGPGPMTKSERLALERLYQEMLPQEQQDLFVYIQKNFAEKQTETSEASLDPISLMEQRVWREPSPGLKAIFSQRLRVKRPSAPTDPTGQS